MSQVSLFSLTLAACFAASGQLLFKLGAHGRQALLDFINPAILLGLLMYGAGTAIWIYTLSYEKLVNVYAFTALTFVIVYAGGVFAFREKLSVEGFVGVFFVLVGLYLITRNQN